MLAVGRGTREGRCQPVESKVAKPVRASGTGTPQKEAWPAAVGTCQAPGPASVEWHQVGEGSACHPRLPRAESPTTETQQHPNVLSDHPRQRQIQQWAANLEGPSAEGRGTGRQGTQGQEASRPQPAPPCLQLPQHQATDPPTGPGPLRSGAPTKEEEGKNPSPSPHRSL